MLLMLTVFADDARMEAAEERSSCESKFRVGSVEPMPVNLNAAADAVGLRRPIRGEAREAILTAGGGGEMYVEISFVLPKGIRRLDWLRLLLLSHPIVVIAWEEKSLQVLCGEWWDEQQGIDNWGCTTDMISSSTMFPDLACKHVGID